MFSSLLLRPTSNCFKLRSSQYETYTALLKNGIKLAMEETTSPVACVSLFLHSGSRYETPENNGISHFIEHMAIRGFGSMKSRPLDGCLKSIGAHFTATTTREYQSFTAFAPVKYTTDLINLMSLVITDIDFSNEEVQEEKKNIIMVFNDCDNDPKQVVFDYLHQAAFQGTPLAQNVIGSIENIENFDENEARCFMNQLYKPENLILAVSGRVNHIDIIGDAQKRFGNVISHSDCSPSNNIYRFTGSSIVYRDDSMPFAHVALALEVPGYDDSDFWPLYVANCILGDWDKSQGGGEGNGAYLARASAVSHLCEFYEPFYITYRDIGLWGVYYVADRYNLDNLFHIIQHQWMYFCTAVTENEVKRGVNYAKLKLAREIEGSINSCQDIGLQILYRDRRLRLIEKYKEISEINADSIKMTGQKYIYDKCPVVAAVGPTESLPDYGRARSEMYCLKY